MGSLVCWCVENCDLWVNWILNAWKTQLAVSGQFQFWRWSWHIVYGCEERFLAEVRSGWVWIVYCDLGRFYKKQFQCLMKRIPFLEIWKPTWRLCIESEVRKCSKVCEWILSMIFCRIELSSKIHRLNNQNTIWWFYSGSAFLICSTNLAICWKNENLLIDNLNI